MPVIVNQFGKPFGGGQSMTSRIAKEFLKSRVIAGYDSAATTNNNERHWANSDNLSADAAMNTAVRKTLRSRSRYEVQNNCYARGIVNTLANDIVGTGAHLQMSTRNSTFNEDAELQFSLWAKEIRLADKVLTASKSKIESGEVFLMFITNPAIRHAVKLDLIVIESDQVRSPFDVAFANDPKNVDGIIFDDKRNVLTYNIPTEHPGSINVNPIDNANPINAADIVHLFRSDRPGQSRGVPEITPALPLFALMRRYTLAVVQSAELAADMAWLIETQHSSLDGIELDDAEAFDAVELERGMGMVLPKGWQGRQMKAEQPTTQFPDFKNALLNEIARCLDMPLNIAAGNSSGYNFASGRLDHSTYFKSVRTSQNYLSIVMYGKILERWLFEATRINGLLPATLGLETKAPLHCQSEWLYDGHEQIDPMKEARAEDLQIQNNTTSLRTIYAAKGKRWDTELRQIAKEKELMEQLEIDDSDVSQTDQNAASFFKRQDEMHDVADDLADDLGQSVA